MRPVGSRARTDMKYKVLKIELASILQSGTDSKRLAKVTTMAVEQSADSQTSQFSFSFFQSRLFLRYLFYTKFGCYSWKSFCLSSPVLRSCLIVEISFMCEEFVPQA